MTYHKQVETNYGFSVDEEMVDIINTLRENNTPTQTRLGCCVRSR
jgi:hypothetical protein